MIPIQRFECSRRVNYKGQALFSHTNGQANGTRYMYILILKRQVRGLIFFTPYVIMHDFDY